MQNPNPHAPTALPFGACVSHSPPPSGLRPTIHYPRPTTHDRPPTTDLPRLISHDRPPTTDHQRPTTHTQPQTTNQPQLADPSADQPQIRGSLCCGIRPQTRTGGAAAATAAWIDPDQAKSRTGSGDDEAALGQAAACQVAEYDVE